jgi:ubiquinone/menaquinone biosynthesis C-methylase UbiE
MSQAVKEFYDRNASGEWSRMDRHPLEFAVSTRHIDSLLRPGDRILDLGGGPGRYAFHYAAKGYRVSLVDLSPGNIAFARRKQDELGVALESAETGDARDLSALPDASFDLVLCMGPLYHLTDDADRARAVRECRRLAKPGGHLVFSFITHMAQAISVLQKWPGRIIEWEACLEHGIATGRNDTAFDTGFTEARLVDPLEVAPFLEAQGLKVLRVAGAQGLFAQSEALLMALPPAERQRWIDFSWRHSTKPSTLGASQHVLGIARRA